MTSLLVRRSSEEGMVCEGSKANGNLFWGGAGGSCFQWAVNDQFIQINFNRCSVLVC